MAIPEKDYLKKEAQKNLKKKRLLKRLILTWVNKTSKI